MFRGDEVILDLGCGDGKITAQMAEKVPRGQVLGTDKSSSMIELARQTFPCDLYPNLSFAIEDIKQINFSHSFNLVTSFSCLHWVENQVVALEKIKQALSPSGKAIILTFSRCSTFWDPIEFVVDGEKWKKYFSANHPTVSFS
ncbi:MAG: class I SAM-dependent methyltransferase [Parachlamydiaceae bacterium]